MTATRADGGENLRMPFYYKPVFSFPATTSADNNQFSGAIAAGDLDLEAQTGVDYMDYPITVDSSTVKIDAELDYFFRSGLSAFSRWGLPRPVAVRPGNFQFDVNFHRAAARSRLRLSSSIAVPIYRPADEHLVLIGGKHRIGEVLELPVFCYTYRIVGNDRLRPLSITACSSAEMLFVLEQAHAHQISPIVILTHPHEYIKRKDFRYVTLRRNRVNQTRLRTLLGFLKQNRGDFATLPISAISDDGPDSTGLDRATVAMPFGRSTARMLENGINDKIWWY